MRKVEQMEPTPTCALLKRYPFLHLRPEQTILKGIKTISGKGEEDKLEAYLLKTDRETFELEIHGSQEFVHFDWEVTAENAEKLFRGMVQEGLGKYIIPTQQYNRVEERMGSKYPSSIVNRQPTTIAPIKLITRSGRVYVHCEAIVYVRDGLYFDEGCVENSFIKYEADLGNGFLESKIEVLIQGPYRTDPLYWRGVNAILPPSDERERKAIILEFERMKEFQKFAQELLKTEVTVTK